MWLGYLWFVMMPMCLMRLAWWNIWLWYRKVGSQTFLEVDGFHQDQVVDSNRVMGIIVVGCYVFVLYMHGGRGVLVGPVYA